MTQQILTQMLEESGALRRGHFLLSSGLHSSAYVQCALLLEDPVRARKVGQRPRRAAALVPPRLGARPGAGRHHHRLRGGRRAGRPLPLHRAQGGGDGAAPGVLPAPGGAGGDHRGRGHDRPLDPGDRLARHRPRRPRGRHRRDHRPHGGARPVRRPLPVAAAARPAVLRARRVPGVPFRRPPGREARQPPRSGDRGADDRSPRARTAPPSPACRPSGRRSGGSRKKKGT